MYIYLHTYIYIYIYIYTHTHTHCRYVSCEQRLWHDLVHMHRSEACTFIHAHTKTNKTKKNKHTKKRAIVAYRARQNVTTENQHLRPIFARQD